MNGKCWYTVAVSYATEKSYRTLSHNADTHRQAKGIFNWYAQEIAQLDGWILKAEIEIKDSNGFIVKTYDPTVN